jgi:HAD superfamily hydrolase (TIGR01490 family)
MSGAARSRKIGAFFDIDGTLLPAPSLEWRFASWLESYGALGLWQIARWSASTTSLLLTDDFGAIRDNKTYLAGLPARIVRDWEGSLAPNALAAFSQGAERIARHLEQGHRIFLISGTLAPLAEIFARSIGGGVEAYATNLEVIDRNWTGFIAGNHMSEQEKAHALMRIVNRCGIPLAESFAYGNEMSDVPMLESVGNPIVVNPDRRLRRIAAQRNWQIACWNSLQSIKANAASALLSPTEAR